MSITEYKKYNISESKFFRKIICTSLFQKKDITLLKKKTPCNPYKVMVRIYNGAYTFQGFIFFYTPKTNLFITKIIFVCVTFLEVSCKKYKI